jgi:N-acyl-L-homoserine lactone synthetase
MLPDPTHLPLDIVPGTSVNREEVTRTGTAPSAVASCATCYSPPWSTSRWNGASSAIGVVIPDSFRKEVLSLGWQAEPLGPAVRIPGGPIGSFLIHVRADTPERLRWTGVYADAADRVPA